MLGGGGLALLLSQLGAFANKLFGMAKAKADVDRSNAETAEIYKKLGAYYAQHGADEQARLELKNKKLIIALDNLIDAGDAVIPLLVGLASPDVLSAETIEKIKELRKANHQARLAM